MAVKPVLDAQFAPIMEALAQIPSVSDRDLADARAMWDTSVFGAPEPVAEIRDIAISADGATIPARLYRPKETTAGLIALSCATEGDIGRALVNAKEREAEKALDQWLELFGNRFYIELQRLGRPDEESYIAAAVTLASRRGVPVVATNDVRFLKQFA